MGVSKNPFWDVRFNVPIAQPGEHTTVTIKRGASFHFHFCCGDMGRTLALCQALWVSPKQIAFQKAPHYKLGV